MRALLGRPASAASLQDVIGDVPAPSAINPQHLLPERRNYICVRVGRLSSELRAVTSERWLDESFVGGRVTSDVPDASKPSAVRPHFDNAFPQSPVQVNAQVLGVGEGEISLSFGLNGGHRRGRDRVNLLSFVRISHVDI